MKPAFYSAVVKTDVLAFSIPIDLLDKLPNDVFDSIKEHITLKKLEMMF